MINILKNYNIIFYKLGNFRSKFLEIFILRLAISMIEIVYPLIIGLLIDQVFYNHNYVSLFGYTSLFGCLFIIQQIFVYIESKCSIFIHNTCLHNIRVYLFDRVLRANAKINISKENGEIINIIDNDCEQIFNFLVNILFGTITQFIQMFILIFILFTISWIYVPLVIGFSISAILLSNVLNNNFYKERTIYRATYGNTISWILDMLQNMRTIHYDSAEQIVYEDFKTKQKELIQKKEKIRFLEVKAQRINEAISIVFMIVFLFVSTLMAINQALTVGAFITLEKYYTKTRKCIGDIFSMSLEKKNVQVSLDRILEIVNYDIENYDEDSNKDEIEKVEMIEFKNVYFKYEDSFIIKDLDVVFKRGEITYLVGRNGCGKSTILSLLFKLYEPQQGKILINSTNIADISIKEIRKKIGYMQQADAFFEGNIKYNLVGEKIITDEEIYKVLQIVGLHKYINQLPEGIYTDIQNGEILSGGQKKRMALARLILRKPEIVILDEPVSAVDEELELFIIKNIKRIFCDKIIVMITHRKTTLKFADYIYVLDKGKVVGEGTHFDLIEKCNMYNKLFGE